MKTIKAIVILMLFYTSTSYAAQYDYKGIKGCIVNFSSSSDHYTRYMNLSNADIVSEGADWLEFYGNVVLLNLDSGTKKMLLKEWVKCSK